MFDKNKIIPIGSDHAGFKMKEYLLKELLIKGFHCKDFGTFSEDSVDYPDFIHPVSKAVDVGEYEIGIIICGSGNGAAMTANKYPHIRAAVCWNKEIAHFARLHNDANIISLPGRFVSFEEALDIVEEFFATAFEGGRHIRRIQKIHQILK
jgi:ribose 5-phosphate isomerase B